MLNMLYRIFVKCWLIIPFSLSVLFYLPVFSSVLCLSLAVVLHLSRFACLGLSFFICLILCVFSLSRSLLPLCVCICLFPLYVPSSCSVCIGILLSLSVSVSFVSIYVSPLSVCLSVFIHKTHYLCHIFSIYLSVSNILLLLLLFLFLLWTDELISFPLRIKFDPD